MLQAITTNSHAHVCEPAPDDDPQIGIHYLPKPPLSRTMTPVVWFGGKGNFKTKLLPYIPYSKTYVEPFGGGGSILFARKPSPVDVYNDLDKDLVGLMRVLREPADNAELHRRIKYTLYGRAEYAEALDVLKSAETCRIKRAWAFYTRQNQVIGGISRQDLTAGTWGLDIVNGSIPLKKWQTRISLFNTWLTRLSNVQIECKDALKILKQYDRPTTVFYLDPPYVASTRSKSGEYAHELTDNMHTKLIDLVLTVQGAVTLSGYRNEIYDRLSAAGWHTQDFAVTCNSAAGRGEKPKRIETIWWNARAHELLNSNTLF